MFAPSTQRPDNLSEFKFNAEEKNKTMVYTGIYRMLKLENNVPYPQHTKISKRSI